MPFVFFTSFILNRIRPALLVLLLGLAPTVAQAQYALIYQTNGNAITLTGFSGIPVDVSIPNFVTSIGDNAFSECSNLTNITIPDGVTSIGNYTFNGCWSLISVTIGANVITIGDGAFYGCFALAGIIIPDKVASIGAYAFVGCALTNVTIPASVTNLVQTPFAFCSSLTNINVNAGNTAFTSVGGVLFDYYQTTLVDYPAASRATSYSIPGSVTTIEFFAFADSMLTNAAIGAGISSIGAGAFSGCDSMAAITVDAQNPNYSSVNGVLFNKNQTALLEYPGGVKGSYTISNGVTSIGLDGFELCSYLTGVTIPNSVTSIGGYAFEECLSLSSVTIGANLTGIGQYAFLSCPDLTAVYSSGNAPSADATVFRGDSLTAYYLPGTTGWDGFATNTGVPISLWQTAPIITSQPASQTIVAGTNVTLTVDVAGDGPFSYQWRLNGTNLPKLITTVAGNGVPGFSGDGGPATNAELLAYKATVDAFGNIYIGDSGNNRVRKVATNGVITTVAGNGLAGQSVNGQAATNTPVYGPSTAVAGNAGNLFISEGNANRIAEIGADGLLTIVAGTGLINGPLGDGGPATNAILVSSMGPFLGFEIALDTAGNLYIADSGHSRIRKVSSNGIITTVAGKIILGGFSGDGAPATNAALNGPLGICLDKWGNLFIADTFNHRVRKVDTNGIINTIAGNGVAAFSGDGGAATNASLNQPAGVALDASGNLLIADESNDRIREVDTNGIITTVAGGVSGRPGDGGAATSASLFGPVSVAVDANGNLIIAEQFGERIREVLNPGPSLLLKEVGPGSAGDYTVVVTGTYGSVTGAVATLTVSVPRTPPQIIVGDAGFGITSNQFGFNLKGVFGQTIIVEASANLVDWTPLFTNSVVVSPVHFSDAAWTNHPWRYYRAALGP